MKAEEGEEKEVDEDEEHGEEAWRRGEEESRETLIFKVKNSM